MKPDFRVEFAALLAATCLLAASCNGKQKAASTGPVAPTVEWAEPEREAAPGNTLPLAAPFYFPNEQMIWKVTKHGIEIAEFALSVGAPGVIDGNKVVVVRSSLRATKAGRLFVDLQQEVTTFVDVATSRPNYHRREYRDPPPNRWIEIKLAAEKFAIKIHGADGKDRVINQTVPSKDPPLDSNSILLALRAWEVKPGMKAEIFVMREDRVWRLQMQYGDTETVETPVGRFPTIRIDGVSRPLKPDGSLVAGEDARQYTIWVTDDAKRLPLMIEAGSDIGTVRMQLVHYGRAKAP